MDFFSAHQIVPLCAWVGPEATQPEQQGLCRRRPASNSTSAPHLPGWRHPNPLLPTPLSSLHVQGERKGY